MFATNIDNIVHVKIIINMPWCYHCKYMAYLFMRIKQKWPHFTMLMLSYICKIHRFLKIVCIFLGTLCLHSFFHLRVFIILINFKKFLIYKVVNFIDIFMCCVITIHTQPTFDPTLLTLLHPFFPRSASFCRLSCHIDSVSI